MTYPNILDTEIETAISISDKFQTSAIPHNYIIDREGRVVDGWYGNDWDRGLKHLEELGVK